MHIDPLGRITPLAHAHRARQIASLVVWGAFRRLSLMSPPHPALRLHVRRPSRARRVLAPVPLARRALLPLQGPALHAGRPAQHRGRRQGVASGALTRYHLRHIALCELVQVRASCADLTTLPCNEPKPHLWMHYAPLICLLGALLHYDTETPEARAHLLSPWPRRSDCADSGGTSRPSSTTARRTAATSRRRSSSDTTTIAGWTRMLCSKPTSSATSTSCRSRPCRTSASPRRCLRSKVRQHRRDRAYCADKRPNRQELDDRGARAASAATSRLISARGTSMLASRLCSER